MARLDVELDRLADPTAWPNRCARCGAHGATLVPVPDTHAKGQHGWRVPLCPDHADDWGQVRRKNRLGMVAVLLGMATAFAITWVVHPRFVAAADDANRFLAALFIGFLSVVPLGTILALWAKTPIRIEKVEGRFASIIGLGRAFKAAAAETVAPPPLPVAPDEVRFEVSPYAPVPTASPEAVGLLFLASGLLGVALGFAVALGGLELREVTKGWDRNDWRYVGLVVAAAAAFGVALAVSSGRLPVSLLGVAVIVVGCAVVAVMSVLGKWFGFPTEFQFSLAFTGLPLVYLGIAVLYPLVWHQRIRHPWAVALGCAVGPLAYTGVVYLVAGLAEGPQRFALGVGPGMAFAIGSILASTARSPYCLECAGWLVSKRLGAVARTRAEMEPLLADGGLVSLSAAKTYAEKTSLHDTELTAFRCEQCGPNGTVVIELSDCQMSGGKNPTPTLTRVGRWLYPGAALPVLDAIFPPAAEDAAPIPPETPAE